MQSGGASAKQAENNAGRPPKMKPFLYTLLAMLFFGSSIWFGNRLQKEARFYEVEVTGTALSTVDEILAAADVQAGMPVDSLQALALLERVEALPQIRRAELELPAPGRIRLNVTERKPVAILVEANRFALVDFDGVVMALPDQKHPDLPLLYGFDIGQPGERLQSVEFQEVSAFLQALGESAVAGATISELGWHSEEGVFGLSHEHSVKLIFGRENFSARLKKWEHFYRDVASQRGMAAFFSLDFRFKNQIVAQEQDIAAS